MWTPFFVSLALSLVLLILAGGVASAVSDSRYPALAPVAALGVVVLGRSIASKANVHHSNFLMRPLGVGAVVIFVIIIVILALAVVLGAAAEPETGPTSKHLVLYGWVKSIALTALIVAVLVPMHWLHGFWLLLFWIAVFGYGVWLIFKRPGWIATGTGLIMILVVVIVAWVSPKSFWTHDIKHSFTAVGDYFYPPKTPQVHPTVPVGTSPGQAAGVELNFVSTNPVTVDKDGKRSGNPHIAANCSTLAVCTARAKEIAAYGQSAAQFNQVTTTVDWVVGGNVLAGYTVGYDYRPGLADSAYSVKGYSCIVPVTGAYGHEVSDGKENLSCQKG